MQLKTRKSLDRKEQRIHNLLNEGTNEGLKVHLCPLFVYILLYYNMINVSDYNNFDRLRLIIIVIIFSDLIDTFKIKKPTNDHPNHNYVSV